MELLVVGLNHRTAAVELRERLAVDESDRHEVIRTLHAHPAIDEVLLVSTCNRVEVVAVPCAQSPDGVAEDAIVDLLAKRGGVGGERISEALYRYRDREAFVHLLRTASSLDSLVVGEPQILGQVKEAYDAAVGLGTVSGTLNPLMQQVFHVAKRIRTDSGVGQAAVSVGSVAAELAQHIFSGLEKSDVALLGAGEMAEQAATKLAASGARSVTVLNRSLERAESLAGAHGWRARPFSELEATLAGVDVLISSTGAREPIVDARMVRSALARRRYRPLFLVDIAVPRDIHASVAALERVYLYNIDDLEDVIARNRDRRAREAAQAEAWVLEEASRFEAEQRGRRAVPVIREMRERLLAIAHSEAARASRHFTPEQQKAVERMAAGIANKMLHTPVCALKEAAREDDGDHAIAWAVRFFGLGTDLGLGTEEAGCGDPETEREDDHAR